MLVHIRKVLSTEQVKEIRHLLDGVSWSNGRDTAGYLSARMKTSSSL